MELNLAGGHRGFGVEGSINKPVRQFILNEDTAQADREASKDKEKQEREALSQQHVRAAKHSRDWQKEQKKLKDMPDTTIEYIGAPCYRSVYCTSCQVYAGSGKEVFTPLRGTRPPVPQPSYTLVFGPSTLECLLPLVDDVEIDELQIDVTHPFGGTDAPSTSVTHVFGKQEYPPVDLTLHHSPPLLDYAMTPTKAEQLFKARSTNKRAMQATLTLYAVELDYNHDVVGRTLIGKGSADLGDQLIKAAAPSTATEEPQVFSFDVDVVSASATRGLLAKARLELRGEAAAWRAAYVHRMRRIYYPDSEKDWICRDCHRMCTTFAAQKKALADRWRTEHERLEAQFVADERGKGSAGVALDYTLLLAGPLGARFGAARALDDMQLLSEDFIGHFKGK